MGLETDSVHRVSEAINDSGPRWGYSSRFFIPNEDARMVCRAIEALDAPVRNPVFVGGAGMILLEAIALQPKIARATYVDISPFQVNYFSNVLQGLGQSRSADDFRRWFILNIYPMLRDHFMRTKNTCFEVDNVVGALNEHFGLRMFFETKIFLAGKSQAWKINVLEDDVCRYLRNPGLRHDFTYLSNIADYLPEEILPELFAAGAVMKTPIYLLVTEACCRREAVTAAWKSAGYTPHPISKTLTGANRGLGSRHVRKGWNRAGEIFLLLPEARKRIRS